MLSLSDKRILVTGGAGFLGKQVIKQLLLAGADKTQNYCTAIARLRSP